MNEKSVNRPLDAMGISRKSFVMLMIWLLWPVVLIGISQNEAHDFLHAAFGNFLYPPAIANITGYWLSNEPVYKRLYVSAWYLNSLFTVCYYVFFLIRNPGCVRDLERIHPLKLLVFAVFCFGISFFYFWILFQPGQPLPIKAALLIEGGLGLFLLLPCVLCFAACAPIAGVCFLIAVWRQLVLKVNAESK